MKTQRIFLWTLSALLLAACVPYSGDRVPSASPSASGDPSADSPSGDPSQDVPGTSQPEGAVSGWKLETTYSSPGMQRTSVVDFTYDAQGRISSYDEKVTESSGEVNAYKRIYNWTADDRMQFHNTSLSHKATAFWELDGQGRTVHYYTPSADDPSVHNDDWRLSYSEDGHLEEVKGYHYIYIDEEDEARCGDWDKSLHFLWDGDGNLGSMYETWTGPGGESETRNPMRIGYGNFRENPFYGQRVDPSVFFLFRDMYLGLYGLTPKYLISGIWYDDEDLFFPGDCIIFRYGFCEDDILREITVERKESGMTWSYKMHIYYFGIPDKDPYIPPVIN